jgi:hypothetical protein
MTVYETAGELLVVDAGLAFPRDEHLGWTSSCPCQDREGADRAVSPRTAIMIRRRLPTSRELNCRLSRPAHALVRSRLTYRLLARRGRGRKQPGIRPSAEFVRMAHSIYAWRVVLDTPAASSTPATGIDHPRRWLSHRRRPAPSFGNAGVDLLELTNAERQGVTAPAHVGSVPQIALPGRVLIAVRLERPPDAAGDRRGARGRKGGLSAARSART